jgi:hypothetical protein
MATGLSGKGRTATPGESSYDGHEEEEGESEASENREAALEGKGGKALTDLSSWG